MLSSVNYVSGSTCGLPFTMGLQFAATHRTSPRPNFHLHRRQHAEIFTTTSSGRSHPLRFTNTAMES